MSGSDREADENGAGRGHTGWWSQRDEIVAYWCHQPDCEADPGAFPGRMTVAPPLEVSTPVKLVFPAHRALAAERGARSMQVLYPRGCGLDIHQKTVVACVLLTDADGTSRRFVRTFGTMTAD